MDGLAAAVGLVKRSPLRLVPPVDRSGEPGYREWHTPIQGECAACGKRGLLLRHHAITENHVRREGGDPWDLRNAIGLGYFACSCHREHHQATRRLPISVLGAEAIEFAIELLGAGRADAELERYYSPG